jgi:hypothetical protein
MVEVFPAMFRRTDGGGLGETVASSEEAACFYHPQKRAVVPCDGCGRFLCALCDVELNNQHLCPGCIQSGRRKGKLRNLENERVLYDRIALTVSIVPLLIWPFTVVSAPAALYLAIRHWKSPRSIVTRGASLRFSLAMLFALAQIGGWFAIVWAIISHHTR